MSFKPLPIADEIRQCEILREKLKEHGLAYYVKLMGEEERSYARRRFREALATHIESLKQGGQNGGTIAEQPERRDSSVAT